MTRLVWFRADLRTADNPALASACRDSGDDVVAVFAICEEQWVEHDWSPQKVDLLLRSLMALRDSLLSKNIPLRVLRVDRFEDVAPRILELAREIDGSSLHFNEEYEWNERQRDQAVVEAFRGDGREVQVSRDQIVLDPGSMRTGAGHAYRVFTPFARRFREVLISRGVPSPIPAPRKRKRTPKPADSDEIPDRLPSFHGSSDRKLWPVGEAHARKRLRRFLESNVRGYAQDRDVPFLDATSRISPYLTLGVLSPVQCLSAAHEIESVTETGPQTWINEILWREFYRHVLIAFPRVSRNRAFIGWTERVAWRDDPESLERWKRGETGVPIVDAGMRQLLRTGWMHNRLRMVTAAFLCKQLLIDWREGERHFMRHLIDGDLASNNGGWQWSASTGTDAAPYFRVFQPVRQSERFDPEGRFIISQIPELDAIDPKSIHLPGERSPLLATAVGYPVPIVDLSAARKRAIEAFRAAKAESSTTRPFP